MNDVLHIDFETRSTVDLKKIGVYVYAQNETTDVWCAAYAFGDDPVELWLPGQPVPSDIEDHVRLGNPLAAHNANFERIIWRYILTPRYGWPEPAIEQWRCTMVMSYAMGLPGALANAAPAAGLKHAKDDKGHRLMLQMARPRKKTKAETIWWDTPDKLQRLYDYCKQDVEVERELMKRLRPLKPSELDLWHLDQKINDRGVCVDIELCEKAKGIVEVTTEKLNAEMRRVTGTAVTACSNVNQITAYVREQGVNTDSIAKAPLAELLTQELPDDVRQVLELRQEAAKASVAKIETLLRGMDVRGRASGLLQFHGASPGRWSGRRFQPQNLMRPNTKFIDLAIYCVQTGDAAFCEAVFGEPLTTVANCLRGMIKAAPGRKIAAADFANIEGRVLAWLAGEEWKLQAFRDYDAGIGPDLYLIMASEITGIPLEKLNKDSPERQGYGKVPELALGFQGGVGAFNSMAVNYGVSLPDNEIEVIRDRWREKNSRIKQFWYDMEYAAMRAVERPGATHTAGRIIFRVAGSWLFMQLPSKRFLAYAYPEIRELEMPWDDGHGNPATKDGLTYFSTIDFTKRSKIVEDDGNSSIWARVSSYGGKLVENATQATARDFMAVAMPPLEAAGYPIVLTVHDEIVAEPLVDHGSVSEMCAIMCDLPKWGEGCPIAAAGFEAERYRK